MDYGSQKKGVDDKTWGLPYELSYYKLTLKKKAPVNGHTPKAAKG